MNTITGSTWLAVAVSAVTLTVATFTAYAMIRTGTHPAAITAVVIVAVVCAAGIAGAWLTNRSQQTGRPFWATTPTPEQQQANARNNLIYTAITTIMLLYHALP